jgi:steroid 5-alpha reductase family enzyme
MIDSYIFLAYGITIVTILLHFLLYFYRAVKLNNFGIIDVGWGQGFVIVVWVLMIVRVLIIGVNSNAIGYLTLLLITLWGVRLASHIGKRNQHKPEDRRYTDMRAKIGPPQVLLKSFVRIFLPQAIFMLLISIVIIHNVFSDMTQPLMPITLLPLIGGVIVWLIGYFFQAIGDRQLALFIAKPENKGKLMREGLWAYTRHPNYFGEVLMWWGIAILGFANSLSWIYPLVAFISPLVITWLIRFVSGVPLLEKHMRKKADFSEYEKTTNVFIPWFPKR